ncbi:MAG: PilZ domain-containing protein [Bacteriovorax sp.]|nr:PilZ domain-containing protein [Bacteriovorax sp.]
MKEQKKSKEFDRMIAEAVQGNLSFFAWQSIGGLIEKCEMKIKAYRKDYNEFELELCDGQDENLEKVISGNRILNIYVPELSVSFSSELKLITSDKKIKLFPPVEYTFYERRKHERVQPAKTCFVSFEHNKVIIKKSIYDFSMGGIAIILSKSDKVANTKGKIYALFVLDIGLRKIKVKAECVNSFAIDRFKFDDLPYGGHKLAFRFTEISKEDRAFIAEFITHEILLQQIQKKTNSQSFTDREAWPIIKS